MPQITIDGSLLDVPEGFTVLQAARQAGISIPTLCEHPDLSSYGGCRLCLVKVKGIKNFVVSCSHPVTDGMEVMTETPDLFEARQNVLRFLLLNYYDAGYPTDASNENDLFKWAHQYDLEPKAFVRAQPRYKVDSDPNPFIQVDRNKCILCARCIRACTEIQGRIVWGMHERGSETRIETGMGTDLLDARCESCGACVAYCPTGALSLKPSIGSGMADKKVTTTCTYCGVGCNLDLEVKDNQVIRVSSNPDAPVNGMHLCVKGRFGYDFIHHEDRLTTPLVRQYLLDGVERPDKADRGPWVEVDWDTALDIAGRKLAETRDIQGADSVGVLTSAKLTNEENYLVNKFARQVIGTNSIDHCARL